MPIRAVIFDLGHTVWDYAPTEQSRRLGVVRLHNALAAALDDVPTPTALDAAFRSTSKRWFERWSDREDLTQPASASFVRDALESLDIEPSDDLLGELTDVLFGIELDMPVVEPDTLAAIAALHERGFLMGCVTNTVLLRTGIEDILDRLGLFRYFRSAVVSSEGGYRKPHASLFRRALDELGIVPEESIFVGDRLWDDIAGAQGAGMRGVLTHQYRQEPPGGIGVKPDAVVRRLSELPNAIEQIEASTVATTIAPSAVHRA